MIHLGDICKINGAEIEPFCISVTKRHFGDEKNPGDAWKYLIGAQKDGHVHPR